MPKILHASVFWPMSAKYGIKFCKPFWPIYGYTTLRMGRRGNVAVTLHFPHGRVVTISRQITEVEQCRAQFVLGWVTGARVTLPATCRGVGQASHIMLPLSTQQWWVPGGTKNGELCMALQFSCRKKARNSPQRRSDRTRESSNTRGVNCDVCLTRWDMSSPVAQCVAWRAPMQ